MLDGSRRDLWHIIPHIAWVERTYRQSRSGFRSRGKNLKAICHQMMMSTKSAKPLNVRKKQRQNKSKRGVFSGSPFLLPIHIAIIYPIIIRSIHREAAPCTDDAARIAGDVIPLYGHIRDGNRPKTGLVGSYQAGRDVRLPGRRAADGVTRGREVLRADIRLWDIHHDWRGAAADGLDSLIV